MAGDFTSDNAETRLCARMVFSSAVSGQWCNDLTGTISAGRNHGYEWKDPATFVDPASAALSSSAEGKCESTDDTWRL